MAIKMVVKRNNRRKDRDNFRYFSELAILDKKRKTEKIRANRMGNIGLVVFVGILIYLSLIIRRKKNGI